MTTDLATEPFTALTTRRRERAIDIAQYLLDEGEGALSVELFGSLARGNVTLESDFDFVVTIDGFDAACWMTNFQKEMGTRSELNFYERGHAKSLRRELAMAYLGLSPWAHNNPLDTRVDIFLFPPNWKSRAWVLGTFWSGWNEQFISNIAGDAITFVPNQGFPFPLTQKPDSLRVPLDD